MKKLLEKISVLALSLMLVSTYSISCVLPKMLEHFSDYSRQQVETLVSIPSFVMAITIFLNIWLIHYVSEKRSIVIGAVALALGGSSTLFIQDYEVMLFSRIMLGFGIGMINARAITMIQCRYEGKERANLLGIRGSVEALGNTFMTFLAGRLMLFGWTASYAIYLTIIPVLFMYLLFVTPGRTMAEEAREAGEKSNVIRYIPYMTGIFLLAFLFIDTNVSATMRMSSLILEKQLGDEVDASYVLTYILIAGVVSGVVFERLLRVLKEHIMMCFLVCLGAGLVITGIAGSMGMIYLGVTCIGFSNGILMTTLFHQLAVKLPADVVETGTYVSLLGANLGASASPIVLRYIGLVNGGMHASYIAYGIVCLTLALGMTGLKLAHR